jgi:hypothetical protein
VTARIISFPRRGRGAALVKRVEGDWLTIFDGQAWPHSSREAALQEAGKIADLIRVRVILQPENSSC